MNELVAIDLPAADLVAEAQRAWEAGNAVLPLRPEDPDEHKLRILRAARPTRIVTTDGRSTLDDGVEVEPGDALVIATSGTTGSPRAVVHTWDSVEASAYMTATGSASTPMSVWLACLPLNHVGGFSVVTRALTTGAGLIVHHGFDAAESERAVREQGATHVSLVPTALRRIQAAPWERILLGGSAIADDRPPNSIATYGMTETMGGIVYDGLALNGAGIRITALPDENADGPASDSEWDRRDASPGELGRIEVSSPTLFRGYRDNACDTGFRPLHSRWFSTSDLGWLEPDTGRLVVQGRSDDLIITGGHKVWPEAVESVLAETPGIADVAVCGLPDPEWGQIVAALVVPGVASEPPELDTLRAVSKESLPAHAAPRVMVLAERIPRTSLGKVERRSLAGAVLGNTEGDTGGD